MALNGLLPICSWKEALPRRALLCPRALGDRCGPGYDHITSAIGGAVAAMHGADFLVTSPPPNTCACPNWRTWRIIAAKIAAHAADIAKNIQVPGNGTTK